MTSERFVRAVLDTNAVDAIAEPPERYNAIQAAVSSHDLDLLWTHVNIDELAAIPDENRRARLLVIAAAVCRFVLTGTTVLDYSRFNFARWAGDGPDVLDAIRPTGNLRDTRDGILAATAEYENADLVTSDVRLAKRAAAYGIRVWTPDELATHLGAP